MTENIRPKRLSKVAKEFNVGISTIVDFLAEKGFELSSSPNSKILPDMYELLLVKFQPDKAAALEAQKVAMEHSSRETITVDSPIETKAEDVEAEEEVFIKGTFSDTKPTVETKIEKVEEVKKEEEPVVEKKEEAVVEKAEEKIEVKEEIVEEKPVEEKPVEEEKEPVEEVKKEEEPVVEKEKVVEAVVEKEEEAVVEKAPEVVEDEVKKEPETKGPKILGKIDLPEKRKSKKTTAKKKKEEKPQEKKEEKKEETPVVTQEKKEEVTEDKKEVVAEKEKPKEEAKEVEAKADDSDKEPQHIQTEYAKLDGPKVLGKIVLPEKKVPAKKKPVGSSSDKETSGGKRRRKRISSVKDEKAKTDQRKGRRYDKGKKKVEKEQPSDEEIAAKVRETLKNLEGGSKKSKSAKYRRQKRDLVQSRAIEEQELEQEKEKIIKVTEFVTANELASLLNVGVTDIIAKCMELGIIVAINQRLDAETLALVAEEFDYKVEFVSIEVQESIVDDIDDPEDLKHRSPIVTVMGHVDHGKTSLLDYIRKTNVIAGEAGGITQHIGAYEVQLEDGRGITFLDTPGHEAFTAMRARGAKVTDIAVIVIAADDSVMPQTKEAINHAQAAGAPIIFAINKIDRPNSNPEKIKEQLSAMNILVEDWGGKFQSQEISAKNGTNIEDLLEKILLEAELLELKANPNRFANGTVIESKLDKGRGYVSKLLVQNGSLKKGDIVLAGTTYGRVKAMFNERDLPIEVAGPSAPVLMLGLSGAPQAGDGFHVMEDEREVKNIATKRQQLQREQGIRTQKHITLDEIGRRIAIGDFKELNIIVKGDVDGSVEALTDAMIKLSSEQVQVNVIHKSVGQVNEADVMLASASDAIIVGFQVRPSASAKKLAESEQIDIRLYSIIYKAIEEITAAIEGMLSPEIEEKIVCNVEVREVFNITKVGTVAGCYVLDGKIKRNTNIRVIRDGIVVFTGNLGSLKRFKDDVKEVNKNYECGLNIDKFNDIKAGDIIEGYEEVEIARTL